MQPFNYSSYFSFVRFSVMTAFWGMLAIAPLTVVAQTTGEVPAKKSPRVGGLDVKLPEKVQKLLAEGESLRKSGDKAKAEAILQKVAEALEKDVAGFNMAQARLAVANLRFPDVYTVGTNEQKRKVLKVYESLPENIPPQVKTQVAINRAALHMALGEAEQAAALLRDNSQVDWTHVKESQRYLLNYTVGRALTESKQSIEAVKYYREAIQLNPRFEPAADRLADILTSHKVSANEIDDQVKLLLASNQFSATKRIGDSLCQSTIFYERLQGLRILLSAWAKSFRDPGRFLMDEEHRLLLLDKSSLGPDLTKEVRRIVSGELKVEPDSLISGRHPELSYMFALLSDAGDQRDLLASAQCDFLLAVADQQVTAASITKDHEAKSRFTNEALSRALVAYGLRSNSGDAGRIITWALVNRAGSSPEDPLRDQLVPQMLDVKLGLMGKEPKTEADWQNLRKIHVLLAQYYQSLKKWTDQDKYRSSVFFWEQARRDETELLRMSKPGQTQPTPLIYENLALCYAKTGQFRESVKTWIKAIELYIETDDLDGAESCLAALRREDSLPFDESQKTLVAALEKRINSMLNQ